MVAVEYIFRSALKTEVEDLLGPTLASAGVGLMLPLVIPKKVSERLPEEIRAQVNEHGLTVTSARDQSFILICLIALFAVFTVWIYTLWLAKQTPTPLFVLPIWGVSCVAYKVWGWSCWIFGVVLSEVKEKI